MARATIRNKIHLIELLIILSAILAVNTFQLSKGFCYPKCKCDMFMDLTRTNCSNNNFNETYIFVDSFVEVLDLSFNNFKSIDAQSFARYKFVNELNLSHNSITSIDANAFEALQFLSILNLSYNNLNSLTANALVTNSLPTGVHLEDLPSAPFLISISLRYLNLRNMNISQISKSMFGELPKLEQLDLSNNLLTTINFNAFANMQYLTTINFDNNNFICDAALTTSLNNLNKLKVEVHINRCNIVAKASEYYKRNPSTTLAVSERQRLQYPMANVTNTKEPVMTYHVHEDDYNATKSADICTKLRKYSMCHIKMVKKFCEIYAQYLKNEIFVHEPMLEEQIFYSLKDLNFIFVMGAAMSTGAVVVMIGCAYCIERLKARKAVKNDEVEQPVERRRNSESDNNSSGNIMNDCRVWNENNAIYANHNNSLHEAPENINSTNVLTDYMQTDDSTDNAYEPEDDNVFDSAEELFSSNDTYANIEIHQGNSSGFTSTDELSDLTTVTQDDFVPLHHINPPNSPVQSLSSSMQDDDTSNAYSENSFMAEHAYTNFLPARSVTPPPHYHDIVELFSSDDSLTTTDSEDDRQQIANMASDIYANYNAANKTVDSDTD